MEVNLFSQEEKLSMILELMSKVVNTVRMMMVVTSLKKLTEKEELLTILVYVPD